MCAVAGGVLMYAPPATGRSVLNQARRTAMSDELSSQTIATLGIDVGKNVFHLIGLNRRGAILLRQKLTRRQLAIRMSNLPPCLVGLEAGVGAHHLGRTLKEIGHHVRLMPANYVRPYLMGHKNDFGDAEAAAEAVQRPTMRFVALKSVEQLDLQALHRVRERLVCQRTGVINQIRGFALERGIAVQQGSAALRFELRRILGANGKLSPRMMEIIRGLAEDWRYLDERVKALSSDINAIAKRNADCKRLMTVPGVGPIISTAMVAAIGSGDTFARGRAFGAWLGLVPRQHSTGGRQSLGRISKRGNPYLRVLFVQAAHAVLKRSASWERYGLKPWIEAAAARLPRMKLVIALAHKLARIAWGVLVGGRNFEVTVRSAQAQ
jgi:transposase